MQIKELILQTDMPAELKEFYSQTIGINIISESENSFTLQTPETEISIIYSSDFKKPFYHFAFNIPENKFSEAKEWAKQRVGLIELDGEDEFDFKSWNAHAIYFYDPAGNIVELIARHNLKNASTKIFTGESLLSISEIGCPVYDVRNFYELLRENFDIPKFSGDMKTFTAAGDDEGLFIIVPDGRKWFPDCQNAGVFPMTVKIISNEAKEVKLSEIPYKIISSAG